MQLECGIAYSAPNVKIVGGIASNQESWPASALVNVR